MKDTKKPVAGIGSTVHFLHPVRGERSCVLQTKPKRNADESKTYIPPDTPVGEAMLGQSEGQECVVVSGENEYTILITKVIPKRAAA